MQILLHLKKVLMEAKIILNEDFRCNRKMEVLISFQIFKKYIYFFVICFCHYGVFQMQNFVKLQTKKKCFVKKSKWVF